MKINDPAGTGIAAFQDRIRGQYPNLKQDKQQMLELTIGPSGEMPTPRVVDQLVWQFFSSDENWRVTLSHNFFGLETRTAYVDRADFLDRLSFVCSSIHEHFEPTLRTRMGVRYVNVLRGDRFQNIEKLVRPQICPFAASPFGEHVVSTTQAAEFDVPEGRLIVRSGILAPNQVHDPTVLEIDPERRFFLDLDTVDLNQVVFSSDQIIAVSKGLTERLYSFFRWAMSAEALESDNGV
jgi:uncharacterized protein (TIGR04255 family)